jgi:hypothetical protein
MQTQTPVTSPATDQPQTGIAAHIYRHCRQLESSLLAGVQDVVIVGEGIVGNGTVSERTPAVYLSPCAMRGYPDHLRPAGHKKKWLMFNGDFVHSNQPDFEERFGRGTFIKLHDRYEGK